jgi:hypothetical protein
MGVWSAVCGHENCFLCKGCGGGVSPRVSQSVFLVRSLHAFSGNCLLWEPSYRQPVSAECALQNGVQTLAAWMAARRPGG